MDQKPLSRAAFARRMDCLGPFGPRPHVAVAVSGGVDSMALTLLAQDWIRARGGRLIPLIVDHGLRVGSGREAHTTAQRLRRCSMRPVILRAHGLLHRGARHQTSRAVRYGLLERACVARGVLHLLLAHHRDDQAETLLIRRRHGSGAWGEAGMAAARTTGAVWLLRPLLDVPKRRLRATCEARGVAWVEDPSNRNPMTVRARARRAVRGSLSLMFARQAQEAGQRRNQDAQALANLLARTVQAADACLLDEDVLKQSDDQAVRALRRVVGHSGSGAYDPSVQAMQAAVQALRRGRAFTVGGCTLRRAGGAIALAPDPRRTEAKPRRPLTEATQW